MDLSFSGAGFMGCYYFGVVDCWNKYIPRGRVRRVAGASAGSLIAAYYCMDLPLDECLKAIIELTEDARSRPLGVFDRSNQIVDVLPRILDQLLPEDAHKRVSGRLYVCMTRLKDFKCVIVNEYETRQDLIDALNCSCFIPVWSGNHVSTYKGVKYIDGGFTNNMPVFDEHTVRVSCFSGASDIAPYDRARMEMLKMSVQGMSINLSWKNMRRAGRALWPPPASYIAELLKMGFHDTKEFILNNDLIQCERCFSTTERELQPIYSRITPTISPAASPNVSRAPSLLDLTADSQLSADRGGSFRLRFSKRFSKQKSSSKSADRAPQKVLPPVKIKEHRRQSAAGFQFQTNRNKSGKKIGRDDVERLKREAEEAERAEKQSNENKANFARKLREKLQQVAAGKPSPEKPLKENADQQATIMPTIVVDCPDAPASETVSIEAPLTIADIMSSREAESDLALRTDSMSSNASTDSAVVLETPASGLLSGSPAEKYLAGSKKRAQSISANTNLLAAHQFGEDRFSLVPSPLPSCPPSPNLNRHCTECIRLRQRARVDDLDETIKSAAEIYSSVKSKDPEREFNSIRWKLACWLRQFGPTKYSYSLTSDSDQDVEEAENDDGVFASGETMAERKAKRKASHPFAWPAPVQQEATSKI